MSRPDSVQVDFEITEDDIVETNDHMYRIQEIREDGTIVADRYDTGDREYTPEEFSRILSMSDEVKVKKLWN